MKFILETLRRRKLIKPTASQMDSVNRKRILQHREKYAKETDSRINSNMSDGKILDMYEKHVAYSKKDTDRARDYANDKLLRTRLKTLEASLPAAHSKKELEKLKLLQTKSYKNQNVL